MFDVPSVAMSVVLHGLLITVLILWSGHVQAPPPVEYHFLKASVVMRQTMPLADKTLADKTLAEKTLAEKKVELEKPVIKPESPAKKKAANPIPTQTPQVPQSKPKTTKPAPPVKKSPKPKAKIEFPKPDVAPKKKELPQLDLPVESEWSSVLESDQKVLEEYDQALSAEVEAEAHALEIRAYYVELIRNRVARHWSRPLSARNGMVVRLSVRLLPDGTVHRVDIKESSGNAAFDQSALQALQRTATLPVPEEREMFDRYFRNFVLQFRPEDLQQ